MVFTLHRYIFRELAKIFFFAAIALTLMMSLGSILRPIQEFGVDPVQALYLMYYFLPVTLTFVLPIAALFAGAMVYGRFTSDNEFDACRASGISLLTLVYPGAILAVIVAIANLLLSFYVMPAFVHRAEDSIQNDAKKILFRNIQRKGYYNLPGTDYLIHADVADLPKETLLGVIITELNGSEIGKLITAEGAKVHFDSYRNFNRVQITAYNTDQMSFEDEGGFFMGQSSFSVEFGSLMGDNIRFKKIDQIKEIVRDPMMFYPVAKLAGETCGQFIAELLAQDISARISSDSNSPPSNHFYKLHSGSKFIEFTATKCIPKDEKKVELIGDVVVLEFDVVVEAEKVTKQPLRTLRSTKAMLHIEGEELDPTLTMELHNATWRSVDGMEGLERRPIIRGLILPGTIKNITDKFATTDALKAIEPKAIAGALKNAPSTKLNSLQEQLQGKIARIMIEIKAEIHSRLTFGIGCMPMIMIGLGLGILKKGGHLLSAFGISVIPAAVLIICMMSGFQLIRNPTVEPKYGVMLMWGGVVFLLALATIIYRKLLKN